MPSARTIRPFAASAAIESSLCERTMPGSVQVAISRLCVRSMRALTVENDERDDDGEAEEPIGLPEAGFHAALHVSRRRGRRGKHPPLKTAAWGALLQSIISCVKYLPRP